MSKPDIHLVDADDEIERQFRLIMRRLAGGVCIITAGLGEDITGMTVTSLTSLSAAPPRLLVSINRQASSFAPIARHRLDGRGGDHRELASGAAVAHACDHQRDRRRPAPGRPRLCGTDGDHDRAR